MFLYVRFVAMIMAEEIHAGSCQVNEICID